ncbi:MAG TPA: TlpA disulfide reductase family protein [Puia sp.]|nr:TlpA disulfide reductase family protein [Puia sp.]
MKKFVFAAVLAPLVTTAQQPDFTLTGRIGHYNAPAKIYFDYQAGGEGKSDSAVLVDGKFKFSGNLKGPATVRMAFAPLGDGKDKAVYTGDVSYFYIGKEHIRLESKDSLANAVITGSPIDAQYDVFNKYTGGPIMALTKQANFEFNSGTDEQRKDTAFLHAVDKRFRDRIQHMHDKELDYARAYPRSFFSLIALSDLTNTAEKARELKPVFDSLDEKLQSSVAGAELEDRINALTTVVPGNMAPDFTENDTTGKPVALSSLRGHYVLVDFWASWCHPCRGENPNLVKQYALYKDKGFQILSVSLDDHADRWKEAIAQDGLHWLQVSDLLGWNNAACKLYAIRAVPSSFLVDPQGKIVATGLRGEELARRLSAIYAD